MSGRRRLAPLGQALNRSWRRTPPSRPSERTGHDLHPSGDGRCCCVSVSMSRQSGGARPPMSLPSENQPRRIKYSLGTRVGSYAILTGIEIVDDEPTWSRGEVGQTLSVRRPMERLNSLVAERVGDQRRRILQLPRGRIYVSDITRSAQDVNAAGRCSLSNRTFQPVRSPVTGPMFGFANSGSPARFPSVTRTDHKSARSERLLMKTTREPSGVKRGVSSLRTPRYNDRRLDRAIRGDDVHRPILGFILRA